MLTNIFIFIFYCSVADSEPKMSYRERKEKEEAKRRQERTANKQKWAEMDQANGGKYVSLLSVCMHY